MPQFGSEDYEALEHTVSVCAGGHSFARAHDHAASSVPPRQGTDLDARRLAVCMAFMVPFDTLCAHHTRCRGEASALPPADVEELRQHCGRPPAEDGAGKVSAKAWEAMVSLWCRGVFDWLVLMADAVEAARGGAAVPAPPCPEPTVAVPSPSPRPRRESIPFASSAFPSFNPTLLNRAGAAATDRSGVIDTSMAMTVDDPEALTFAPAAERQLSTDSLKSMAGTAPAKAMSLNDHRLRSAAKTHEFSGIRRIHSESPTSLSSPSRSRPGGMSFSKCSLLNRVRVVAKLAGAGDGRGKDEPRVSSPAPSSANMSIRARATSMNSRLSSPTFRASQRPESEGLVRRFTHSDAVSVSSEKSMPDEADATLPRADQLSDAPAETPAPKAHPIRLAASKKTASTEWLSVAAATLESLPSPATAPLDCGGAPRTPHPGPGDLCLAYDTAAYPVWARLVKQSGALKPQDGVRWFCPVQDVCRFVRDDRLVQKKRQTPRVRPQTSPGGEAPPSKRRPPPPLETLMVSSPTGSLDAHSHSRRSGDEVVVDGAGEVGSELTVTHGAGRAAACRWSVSNDGWAFSVVGEGDRFLLTALQVHMYIRAEVEAVNGAVAMSKSIFVNVPSDIDEALKYFLCTCLSGGTSGEFPVTLNKTRHGVVQITVEDDELDSILAVYRVTDQGERVSVCEHLTSAYRFGDADGPSLSIFPPQSAFPLTVHCESPVDRDCLALCARIFPCLPKRLVRSLRGTPEDDIVEVLDELTAPDRLPSGARCTFLIRAEYQRALSWQHC
eukprot:TRINITY_DN21126_c0_g1_i1.p1 TRINITY_DN21126_c0_g1~~TRINITY_DN21126_c0_g1_i1.p1  ORF type:complete len:839 (+),score=116.93 TRINITY_DN21126_c0_g1_i1:172-2517(+)